MEHSPPQSNAAVPPREDVAPEPAMPGDLPPTCGIGQLSEAERQQLANSNQPAHVGRYRLHHKLGEGGFGTVYLADDPQLHRRVAIKVPRLDRKWTPLELENYRREAQVLAQFEHENIVRVFDIGQDELFPVYIVSQFIDGIPLNKLVGWFHVEKKYRYIARAIQFLAQALKYAHERGVVHRDLKPANVILRNGDFQIFLMDFGLALRDEDTSKGQPCGTPGYASPEQVGGEAHRVDGRSDLYSLGVLLYEMLSGRVPFPTKPENVGSGWKAWLDYRDRVQHTDVRPPRQLDSSIPKELERICLKLLERRASDRYSCAADLLEDLIAFVASVPETLIGGNDAESVQSVAAAANVSIENQKSPIENSLQTPTAGPSPTPGVVASPGTPPLPATPTPPLSDETVLKIVPKGLRSFDAADKDFFLDLLPGARDREGLPESLRFWKTRIESTSAESTFSVGVLYGPSGCGKSSLLKAGLLPCLSERIVTVYLEATGTDTELRLQRSVQRACDLTANGSLSDTLRAVRQGQGVPSRGKVLLVIDQFEQWLHANRESAWTELAVALRQCDGERLQCLLLVRDDFWLAISRLLSELEVPLLQGVNSAMADLFDLPHARRVLSAFGVAYGALPPRVKNWSVEQYQFLDQSVVGLAQEGKIISVRLALFAEMVKSKPWTPATLHQIGGVSGVGVTFLEETFSATTAPVAYRTHQAAVRAVLSALLPEAGTEIRGHMVKKSDLLLASGYAIRPRDFDTLLHILDRDLRLITPVADEQEELGGGGPRSVRQPAIDDKPPDISKLRSSYQLTHDYLVPSLREWLTQKKKQTRQGRAELILEERVSAWQMQKEARQLPSLQEWWRIYRLTDSKRWSEPQCKLMRATWRHHRRQLTLGFFVLVFSACVVGYLIQLRTRQARVEGLISTLMHVPTETVRATVDKLDEDRSFALPPLRSEFHRAEDGSLQQINAALALARLGDTSDQAKVRALLRLTTNPTVRTELIHQFVRSGSDSDLLFKWLQIESDVSVRRALLLAVGEYWGRDEPPTDENDPPSVEIAAEVSQSEPPSDIVSHVLGLFSKDPDAGIHASAEWALRRWKKHQQLNAARKALVGRPLRDNCNWFVDDLGHTFTVVRGPVEFWMGSTETTESTLEDFPRSTFKKGEKMGSDWEKPLHKVTLTYSFAVGTHEISRAEFSRFRPEVLLQKEFSETKPDPDKPINRTSWDDAVAYCNWSSEQEHLPEEDWFPAAPAADSRNIVDSTGYRLPTEAEWEYVCRATTISRHPWGDSPSNLKWYAHAGIARPPLRHSTHGQMNHVPEEWKVVMGSRRPGSLKPNDFGAFDMIGNVNEWCHDWAAGYSQDPCVNPIGGLHNKEAATTRLDIDVNQKVVRGASFMTPPSFCRSAFRSGAAPSFGSEIDRGFRLARTLKEVKIEPPMTQVHSHQ